MIFMGPFSSEIIMPYYSKKLPTSFSFSFPLPLSLPLSCQSVFIALAFDFFQLPPTGEITHILCSSHRLLLLELRPSPYVLCV